MGPKVMARLPGSTEWIPVNLVGIVRQGPDEDEWYMAVQRAGNGIFLTLVHPSQIEWDEE